MCSVFTQIKTKKFFPLSTGIKEPQAAQRCAPLPWPRWKEPSAGATERWTGRPSSGTPTTTLCPNHVLGRWVGKAISCDKQYNSTSFGSVCASVHSRSVRLCSVRIMQVHVTDKNNSKGFLLYCPKSVVQKMYLSLHQNIQLSMWTDFWAIQQVSLM